MLTRKIFESRVSEISRTLGRDFTEFWWSENDIVTYQRPWPMFLLYSLSLGAPIWLGAPRFSRSEPIVVTPLRVRTCEEESNSRPCISKFKD